MNLCYYCHKPIESGEPYRESEDGKEYAHTYCIPMSEEGI